jgi:16S rRNA (guanine1207-N2)-methyltransferase
VRLRLPDLDVDLVTDRGVFAVREVDPGTRFLLKEAPPPPSSGTILDLGCGYGAIAVTLAKRAPDADVLGVDVNRRALELTAENARRTGVSVRVAHPDDVEADMRLAAIYSNPPIRVGKAALHELLDRWLPLLGPGAHAYLVVLRHLGADSLAAWLEERGYTVTRLGSRRGYRLLEVHSGGPTPHDP